MKDEDSLDNLDDFFASDHSDIENEGNSAIKAARSAKITPSKTNPALAVLNDSIERRTKKTSRLLKRTRESLNSNTSSASSQSHAWKGVPCLLGNSNVSEASRRSARQQQALSEDFEVHNSISSSSSSSESSRASSGSSMSLISSASSHTNHAELQEGDESDLRLLERVRAASSSNAKTGKEVALEDPCNFSNDEVGFGFASCEESVDYCELAEEKTSRPALLLSPISAPVLKKRKLSPLSGKKQSALTTKSRPKTSSIRSSASSTGFGKPTHEWESEMESTSVQDNSLYLSENSLMFSPLESVRKSFTKRHRNSQKSRPVTVTRNRGKSQPSMGHLNRKIIEDGLDDEADLFDKDDEDYALLVNDDEENTVDGTFYPSEEDDDDDANSTTAEDSMEFDDHHLDKTVDLLGKGALYDPYASIISRMNQQSEDSEGECTSDETPNRKSNVSSQTPHQERRTRCPPLAFWKNEKPVYGRRKSSTISSVVDLETMSDSETERKSASQPSRSKFKRSTESRVQRKKSALQIQPVSLFDPISRSTFETVVVVPEESLDFCPLKKTTKSDQLCSSALTSVLDGTSSNPIETENIKTANALFTDKFSSGTIVLEPDAISPSLHSPNNAEVFYVVSGKVQATINGSSMTLAKGAHFFIPPQNPFTLLNPSKRVACRICYFVSHN